MRHRGGSIERPVLSGLRTPDVVFGDGQRLLCDSNAVRLPLSSGNPRIHVGGIGRGHLRVYAQPFQVGLVAPDHVAQCEAGALNFVIRRDFLRDDLVIARLSFVGVDDGRGAHLKVAFCLRQLLSHGRFLRLHQSQIILCQQHVEISL